MAGLQEILARLLVPNNAVIQQATRELQAVYKDPAVIPALCDILLAAPNAQIRQFAAVLLRKRLVKVWKKLPPDACERIRATLLQCLIQESVHIVNVSIVHLVSVIAKHELNRGPWNELSQFISQYHRSPEPQQREICMLLLSSLMDTAAPQLQPQFTALLHMFAAALEDPVSQLVPFYALKSLTAMVEYIREEETLLFRALIPKVMVVIKTLIAQDEDKACEAMELFDELVECDIGIVVPYLSSLIQFCLEIATNTHLGNNIRVKALSFVSWLITLKKKALLRHGLLPSILQTMLAIMATPGEEEEEGEDSAESQSPITLAAQVLDVLALHLPPDTIYTPVLQLIEPWVESGQQFERAAAMIAVAVMTEGCADHIRRNHLPTLLQVVSKGINDQHRVVRNAALFAIGQFSEHLQPDISKYSGDILPVLFEFVDFAIRSPQEESSGLTKIFYALETFCEQLGEGLVPHLPILMDKLFLALTVANNIHIRELAISGFGAAANACQESMLPYFPRIVEVLKEYLSLPYNQDVSMLQAQAVDTLGTLSRTVGEQHFRPLAQECIVLGMNLMQSDDPDLRRSVYGMLASVSSVLKEAMAVHLQSIVGRMVESLQSEEGVTVHYASSQVPLFDFEESEEEEEGGGAHEESLEDDTDIEGFTVENAYLEEKEDTCNALGEIAENVGAHFLPYIDDCYREVNILTEHSAEGIRKAAIWTQGRLCKVWYKCLIVEEDRENLDVLVNSTLLSMAATVRTDSDRTVVIATLETLEDMLKGLKGTLFCLADKPMESLAVSLQDIFEQKAECQGETGEEEGVHTTNEMAEYDGMLLECAGNVVGPLASVVGGEAFLPWLSPLLPPLLGRLKPKSTVADRSFAIGTLAEIVDGMGGHSRHLLDLYPVFVTSLSDGEDEVCSNAVYGLGLLAANALPDVQSCYPEILQSLFTISQRRKGTRILDNICAAVCRMVMASEAAVPLDQVLPFLLANLPLKEDMEENKTVYSCILHLFENKNPVMMSQLQPMLKVIALELSPMSKLEQDLKLQLAKLVQALNSQCSDEMQVAVTGLTQDEVTILNTALQQAATI